LSGKIYLSWLNTVLLWSLLLAFRTIADDPAVLVLAFRFCHLHTSDFFRLGRDAASDFAQVLGHDRRGHDSPNQHSKKRKELFHVFLLSFRIICSRRAFFGCESARRNQAVPLAGQQIRETSRFLARTGSRLPDGERGSHLFQPCRSERCYPAPTSLPLVELGAKYLLLPHDNN